MKIQISDCGAEIKFLWFPRVVKVLSRYYGGILEGKKYLVWLEVVYWTEECEEWRINKIY
jgi:hypothetical protein